MTIENAKKALAAHTGSLKPDDLIGAAKYMYKHFTPDELRTYAGEQIKPKAKTGLSPVHIRRARSA